MKPAVLSRIRARLGHERGSVLALTAILMVPLLGFAAFAVDLGNWYQVRRQAQAAADAGALAGVQDLPQSSASAIADANAYAGKDISGASIVPTTPYNGDSSQIQVTVTKAVPSIFGSILGITSKNVSATAVAKSTGSSGAGAIFAYDSDCSHQGVTLNGNNLNVNGGTHSNGSLFANSNNSNFGNTTYGGPNGCNYTANGNNDSYGGSPTPTRDPKLEPWPQTFSTPTPQDCANGSWQGVALFCSSTGFQFNSNNVTLPTGVYYATGGTIDLNGNHLTGTVTFIGSGFSLNSNNTNFTPAVNNLLIFNTGTQTLTINGNSYVNGGTIYSPNGPIVWNGNSGNATGFIEGLQVTVNGNNLNFSGNGPPVVSGGTYSLIQ